MRAWIPVLALALSACGPAAAPPPGEQKADPGPPPPLKTFFPDELAEEDLATPNHDPVSCRFQVPWPAAPDANDVLAVSVTRAVLRALGERHVLLPGGSDPVSRAGVPTDFAGASYSASITLQAERAEPDSLGNQITPGRLTLRDAWRREVYAGDGALVCFR